jgi:hypothetical protein
MDMEKILIQLANSALKERAVFSRKLENGMNLLVYPLPSNDGVLVALGYERDWPHPVQAETILQRRVAHMKRFGSWMPSRSADGAWYVVRRVAYAGFDSTAPVLDSEDLMAAQELLA